MKQLSKKWKIFIITIVVLIGSFYGYYKINNRNAFEEMYNSYFNVLPLSAIDNMGQIKPIRRDDQGFDVKRLYYKRKVNDSDIGIFLINFNNKKKIYLISSTYNMDNHELRNTVTFRGENVPRADDENKQKRELLEKYNISKEYLQEKSDELLNTVLTDWKRYSGSSYSKDNMGRLTIEKDEILR